ncbi:hypothetical protein [Paraburkholderia sp. JPY419]|uniref:hypothetical protein n=1 Tax=Paraburkholderia sp. JPY419 TaxID=667660 RepID=UPI003D2447F5
MRIEHEIDDARRSRAQHAVDPVLANPSRRCFVAHAGSGRGAAGRSRQPPLADNGTATAGARKLVVRGMEMEVDVSDDGAAAASNDGNAAAADGDDDVDGRVVIAGLRRRGGCGEGIG